MVSWCFASCSDFFFFFPSFLAFFYAFSLFWPFGHFYSAGLFCLFWFFFLFFLARIQRKAYMHAWGVPGHPFHPRYWTICSVVVMWRPQYPCGHFPHTHACPQLCPARPPITLFALFCVCWVPMHPPAPIRTHPHPPESLLTPLCLHTHICLFWGNFPAIHGRESHPSRPFLSLFVLFACALVVVHPIAPMQTHIHPYTPIYTHMYPSAP